MDLRDGYTDNFAYVGSRTTGGDNNCLPGRTGKATSPRASTRSSELPASLLVDDPLPTPRRLHVLHPEHVAGPRRGVLAKARRTQRRLEVAQAEEGLTPLPPSTPTVAKTASSNDDGREKGALWSFELAVKPRKPGFRPSFMSTSASPRCSRELFVGRRHLDVEDVLDPAQDQSQSTWLRELMAKMARAQRQLTNPAHQRGSG